MESTGKSCRRIVVIGAESTGKSDLCEQLSAEYGVPCSVEFARRFVARAGRAVEARDVPAILEGQRLEESLVVREAEARGSDWVLLDTNVLSTAVYARELYGIECELARDEYGRDDIFYLLCRPDIPWVADPGQRESPESRAFFDVAFTRVLADLGVRFADVKGVGDARAKCARRAIEAFLVS